jgi:hypothetical protein
MIKLSNYKQLNERSLKEKKKETSDFKFMKQFKPENNQGLRSEEFIKDMKAKIFDKISGKVTKSWAKLGKRDWLARMLLTYLVNAR